jgi:hypothetical protein
LATEALPIDGCPSHASTCLMRKTGNKIALSYLTYIQIVSPFTDSVCSEELYVWDVIGIWGER